MGESVKVADEKEENSSGGRFWGRRKAPGFSMFCRRICSVDKSIGASDTVELSTGESFSSKRNAPESCEGLANSPVLDVIFFVIFFVVVGEEVGDGLWGRRNVSGSFAEAN